MQSIENRKKELVTISLMLSEIANTLNTENIELLTSYSYPRIYGHFEKYIEIAFLKILETILDSDIELKQIKIEICYYFLFVFFNDCSYATFFNKNISLKKTTQLNKNKIISYTKDMNIGYSFNTYLIKLIKTSNDEDLNNKIEDLKIKIGMITKKYKARCDLAHGHMEYDPISLTDLCSFKEIVLKTLDLIKEITDIYLEKKYYLN